MQFDEALRYLLSLGHETLAMKLGLRNIEVLLNSLGNPQKSFQSIQIAGTNGKGSTAVVIDSILRAAGIRSGLYTSPHLVSVTERIRVGGEEISREEFARLATKVRQTAEQLVAEKHLEALPTFFEQVTAIALLAFQKTNVVIAVLETGLGGRLDATTCAEAETVVITPVAMDHETYLGNTIEQIAAEKAAIIRPGVTAIVAPQTEEVTEVILKYCAMNDVTPVFDQTVTRIDDITREGQFKVTFETQNGTYPGVPLALLGRHQIANTSLAIVVAEALQKKSYKIPGSAIAKGIETAKHPGRLELISGSPSILLDGAHNPAGAKALREYLLEFAPRPLTLVFGAMNDKKLEEMAEVLFPVVDHLILTEVSNPRTARREVLEKLGSKIGKPSRVQLIKSALDAIRLARKLTPANGSICVAGSLYLIGELRDAIMTSKNLPLILNSTEVFHGRVFSVTVDTIREDSTTYQREVVHHTGSAVIIPVFDDGTVALVRQYRHPAVRYLLEVPAGTLNKDETPEVGAARELQEELGLIAGRLEKLTEFFVSPGFLEEKMWLYLATDLTETKQMLEEDEIVEVVRLPMAQALEMITDGEIEDAKTIIGLMLAAPRIGPALLEATYPAV